MNEQERAIRWFENELRLLHGAPALNGCDMTPEWAEQICVMETAITAIKLSMMPKDKGGITVCDICGLSPCRPGCPHHPDPVIVCPVCGRECEDLYVTATSGDVVGCDQCIQKKDALDVMQESL